MLKYPNILVFFAFAAIFFGAGILLTNEGEIQRKSARSIYEKYHYTPLCIIPAVFFYCVGGFTAGIGLFLLSMAMQLVYLLP